MVELHLDVELCSEKEQLIHLTNKTSCREKLEIILANICFWGIHSAIYHFNINSCILYY